MKINERWEELKEESNANIQRETGILKRQTRSIQTEGYFGNIKENEDFRRFNYRSAEKVYKEFMLYLISRNIMKYHRFLYHEIEKLLKIQTRGFCALKQILLKGDRPVKHQCLEKTWILKGMSHSCLSGA